MKKIFAVLYGFAIAMVGCAIGFAIIEKDFDSIALAILCILLLASLFFNDYLYGWKEVYLSLHSYKKTQLEYSIRRSNHINIELNKFIKNNDINIIYGLIMETDEETELLGDMIDEHLVEEKMLKNEKNRAL